MTNSEAASHIREYVNGPHGSYAWPTYACSDEQHLKYVEYRRSFWHMYKGTYNDFILEYADRLERGELPGPQKEGQ